MLLATTQVEDVDRLHGGSSRLVQRRSARSTARRRGAFVFRDPSESDRVWGIFDWDEQGWQSFVSDPDVRPILAAAGVKGRLQAAELVGSFGA